MADYIGAKEMLGEMWRRIKDYLTPDYRNAYEIGAVSSQLMKDGDTYTVPADGWILYYWESFADAKYLVIDGYPFEISANDADLNGHSAMFQVTKGTVLEVPTQANHPGISGGFGHYATRLYFIPHRNAETESVSIDMRCLFTLNIEKNHKYVEEKEEMTTVEDPNNSCSTIKVPTGNIIRTNYFYVDVTPILHVEIRNPLVRQGQSIKSIAFTIHYDGLIFSKNKTDAEDYDITRTVTVTPDDGYNYIYQGLGAEENIEFYCWRGRDSWPGESDTWRVNFSGSVSALVTLEDGTTFTLNKSEKRYYYNTQDALPAWRGYCFPGLQYSAKAVK